MSRVIPIANAAVSIKPMMTQFEPNVSIVTSARFPSIGINQTSGRQGGGRINKGILPRMAEISATGRAGWRAPRPSDLPDLDEELGRGGRPATPNYGIGVPTSGNRSA